MPVATMELSHQSNSSVPEKKHLTAIWTKSPAVFPYASCEGHSACSIGTQLFVFGGVMQCEGIEMQESNDLYKFDIDIQIWLQVDCKGDNPAARCNATLSAVGSQLYLFGGLSHSTGWFNDLYSFDTESNTWTKLQTSGTPPSPRDKLSSAVIGHNIYFFGGFGPKASDSMDDIDEEEWSDEEEVIGDIEAEQEAAQFGWFNDLFIYNTVSASWSQPMQMNLGVPSQRAAHSLVALNNHQLIVFAGRDSVTRCNDVHVFNIETRKWDVDMKVKGAQPLPRSFHASTIAGRYMVVIGGRGTQNQHFSDFHLFDTAEKGWIEVVNVEGEGPCGRGTHTCHVVGDQLVVFGGSSDYSQEMMQCQTFYTDTHILNIAELLPRPQSPTKTQVPLKH